MGVLGDRLILRQPLALLVGKAGLVQELPGGGGVAGRLRLDWWLRHGGPAAAVAALGAAFIHANRIAASQLERRWPAWLIGVFVAEASEGGLALAHQLPACRPAAPTLSGDT